MGGLAARIIRLGVRLTGKHVAKKAMPWLECPMGPDEQIGAAFYEHLARSQGLHIRPAADAGLLSSFGALQSPEFEPSRVHPAIRDFYERTSSYRLEAWSEASVTTRLFLQALTRFVSRRMDQLNFPVSSLELAGGMTSDVLPMVNAVSGERVYTGWLRRLVATERVIYTGLYSLGRPGDFPHPCVKVTFPLPRGSSTVFLRPVAEFDGSFKLISAGRRFGDPGFYRMLEVDRDHWRVRYIKTLREFFHVYVDKHGTLRTDHLVRFLGLTVLRLHYKIEPLARSMQTVPQTAPVETS